MATINTAKKIIRASRHSGVPVILWGEPGIGKSAIVKQLTQEMGIDFIDVRASLTEPGDFLGLPVEITNKKTGDKEFRFLISSFLPRDPEWKGILFLDELPCAQKEVMNALLQLTLDRKIMNHYELPKGAFIVAAGNPHGFDNYVTELPGALRSRFLHINLTPTQDEWFEYANKMVFRRDVVRFAASFPKYLSVDTQEFDLSCIKPNKRSFEMLSSIMNQFEDKDDLQECVTVVASGLLGTEAGVQYAQFIQQDFNKIETDKILNDYVKIRATVKDFVEKGLVPEQKQAVEEFLNLKELTEKNMRNEKYFNNTMLFLSDLTSDIGYIGVKGLCSKIPFTIKEIEPIANTENNSLVRDEVKKLFNSLMVLVGKKD